MWSVALLGRSGPLLRLINAARLFPQGPSRELPKHCAAACVTELKLHRLRLRVRLSAVGAETRDALDRDRQTWRRARFNMRVLTDFDDKPIAFWQCHEELLPILSKVARVYLGMSSSSVPVECNVMFSTTGIISRKRSSIGPGKLNRVVFIHHNFFIGS